MFAGLTLTDGTDASAEQAFAMFPKHTFVHGECQVTLLEVPGHPDELYFLNCITKPESRRTGEWTRLMEWLYGVADAMGVTLVTHPGTDWIEQWLLRCGYQVNHERPTCDGRPFMVRTPSRSSSSVLWLP